jgi:hypothetical protein
MPLEKGKSEKAFTHNIKAEMHAGKPQNQALAIAYSMKRKAKKASGGTVESGDETMNMAQGGMCPNCGYAEGGMLTKDGYQSENSKPHQTDPMKVEPQNEWDEEPFHVPSSSHENEMAKEEDDRDLNQHGEMEEGPYAQGGMLTEDGYQSEEDEEDMVGRVMKERQKCFSEGGKIANSDELTAGFEPNEFDDLHLRDGLESHYTGENSGDELSDAEEDKRRKDIVSFVMASRKKRPRKVA